MYNGKNMQKVVFDVDDTLWSLNKRVSKMTGVDYDKLTTFSIYDNVKLTEEEKKLILSAYSNADIFKNMEWDEGVETINDIVADVYINSNNLTEDIATLKREQIHDVINIADDHIIMNVIGSDKSSITKKVIDKDVYILVDDSLHNVEMSNAKHNIVVKRPWNQHSEIPEDKNVIIADDLKHAIRIIESIISKSKCPDNGNVDYASGICQDEYEY